VRIVVVFIAAPAHALSGGSQVQKDPMIGVYSTSEESRTKYSAREGERYIGAVRAKITATVT